MGSQIGRSIDAVVRDALAPSLKAAGFRKQARTFRRRTGDAIHVVNVQASKWNAGSEGQFTINLGIYFPAAVPWTDWPDGAVEAPSEAHCLVRRRIGLLMPVRQDHWWTIDSGTDITALGREVADAWQRYGAPWFETVPDLGAAGDWLEAESWFYWAAVAALAIGDRDTATRRLAAGITVYPNNPSLRAWGTRHGLLATDAAG